MAEANAVVNLSPLLQYGFAGYALAQLLLGVWIAYKVIDVLGRLRDVLAANTAAMSAVDESVKTLREDVRAHPCHLTVDQLRDLVRRLQPAPDRS